MNAYKFGETKTYVTETLSAFQNNNYDDVI